MSLQPHTWIEVYAKAKDAKHFEQVLNGPFSLSPNEFEVCRQAFQNEFAQADEKSQLLDCWVTTARRILKERCPHLGNFDILMLGNALAMDQVRVIPVTGDQYNG